EELGLEIKTATKDIYEKNLEQEKKLRERKEYVADNIAEYDVLWKMLADISKKGKLVMAHDKQMADEYMLTHILKKARKSVIAETKKKKVVAVTEKTEEAKTEDQPQE
ncbi:hypothetical protein ADUPG1_004577, partial [Aduncisulcus paluster]